MIEGKYILSVLGFLILAFALMSVTTKKIFRAAIYLLFSLIGVASIYFYLEYEFIAAVQVVVYVGGIVVLILFSLFLTQQISTDLPEASKRRSFFVYLAVLFGFAFVTSLMLGHNFFTLDEGPQMGSTADFGRAILNYGDGGFVLPFEVVSILLLAAMIGAIAVATKTKKSNT